MFKFANDPFEYVAPFVCIGVVISMLLGPIYFPRLWILFLSGYFMILFGTQLNHLIQFYKTSNNIKRTIKQGKNVSTNHITTEMESCLAPDDLVHAIVVPNYAEPEALIKDTINRIAIHKKASTNYVIILAMEASEPFHKTKSDHLKEYFKNKFFDFIVTNHPSDLPGEARGKGSNISYAARKGCAELIQNGMDVKRIMITIADSDSHIPELYMDEVEREFKCTEDPYFRVYAPPIFFGRNSFNVPAAVRVTDITWSSMMMANLSSSRGIGFPCSTYSLSCALADTVGYWDTDADAVGEDMHMTLKCIFKTQGRARMIPIYVPINLMNVETEGYLSNLNARFVQAKRHYNGVADVSFTLRNALNLVPTCCVDSHYNPFEKMIIVLKVFETHFIPVTSGWIMFFSVPLMQFIFNFGNPILESSFYMNVWHVLKFTSVFSPLPLFCTLFIYENLHRFIDIEFLNKTKQETRTWIHYFDYISMPVAAWLFMTVPSNIASCKRLFKSRDQYIVAEKIFHDSL